MSDTRRLPPYDEPEDGSTMRLPDPESGISVYRSPIPDRLRIVFPDSMAMVFEHLSPHLIIGRTTKNQQSEVDVDLAGYDAGVQGVSRVHAMIQPTKEGLMLKDLGSTNGTHINNHRLEPDRMYKLQSGMSIKIGNLRLNIYFEYNADDE